MSDSFGSLLSNDMAAVDSAPVPAPDTVIDRALVLHRRHVAQRRAVAGSAAVVVLLSAVIVVWATRSTSGEGRISSAGATTSAPVASTTATAETTTVPATGEGNPGHRFVALPPNPRGAVTRAAVVWTGTEAWAVGGEGSTVAAGIDAYNPATQQWRVVSADVPVPGEPLVIAADSTVVLLGRDGARVAVFQAGADYPALVADYPLAALDAIDRHVPAVWNGHEVLVWPTAADPTLGVTAADPVAFDPVARTFRSLAHVPIAPRSRAASVWTGTEWIVWGGTDGADQFADGAAYDPATDTWRVLAESPLSARRAPGVWTGTELLVATGASGGDSTGNGEMALSDGAAYDPATDTWRPIAFGLAHPGFTPIWTGAELLLFAKGGAVWYDPVLDQWSSGEFVWGDVPHDDSSPVWTGEVVLLLGSYDGSTGGATFTVPK